jgi:hypothetical protein
MQIPITIQYLVEHGITCSARGFDLFDVNGSQFQHIATTEEGVEVFSTGRKSSIEAWNTYREITGNFIIEQFLKIDVSLQSDRKPFKLDGVPYPTAKMVDMSLNDITKLDDGRWALKLLYSPFYIIPKNDGTHEVLNLELVQDDDMTWMVQNHNIRRDDLVKALIERAIEEGFADRDDEFFSSQMKMYEVGNDD